MRYRMFWELAYRSMTPFFVLGGIHFGNFPPSERCASMQLEIGAFALRSREVLNFIFFIKLTFTRSTFSTHSKERLQGLTQEISE